MSVSTKVQKPFGNVGPFAEPAWYNALASPYYNDSHSKLRNFVRGYLQEHVIPNTEEWEEQGSVPREEVIRYARAGLAFEDMPAKYRPGIGLAADIPESGMAAVVHFKQEVLIFFRVGYVPFLNPALRNRIDGIWWSFRRPGRRLDYRSTSNRLPWHG